jgi:hypothetical protein
MIHLRTKNFNFFFYPTQIIIETAETDMNTIYIDAI